MARPLKNNPTPPRGRTGEIPAIMPGPEEYARLCDATSAVRARPSIDSGVKLYSERNMNKAIVEGNEVLVAKISVEGHPMRAAAAAVIDAAYNRLSVPADMAVPAEYVQNDDVKHTSSMHEFGRFVGRVAEIRWGAPFLTLDTDTAAATDESFEAMTADVQRFAKLPNGLIVVDRFSDESYHQVEPVLVNTDFPIVRLIEQLDS